MNEEKTTYLKEFYTLEQLSKELNINIQSLRQFIKNKELNASKVAKRYVVTRDDIKEWLKNNEV